MKDIDKQIIDILNRDARASHAQIAEEVGLSRPTIAERIKKSMPPELVQEECLYLLSLNP